MQEWDEKPKNHMKRIAVFFSLVALACGVAPAAAPQVNRVVLIGVDGLGARWIPWGDMPTLSSLRANGLYATGRCLFPTSSGINWPGILHGTIAELHGFRDNSGKPEVEPWRDREGNTPCVFSEVRRQYPEAFTASIYDWAPISRMHNTNAVSRVIVYRQKNWADHAEHLALDAKMVDDFAKILERDPKLVFLYQHSVDHAGHTYGWGSPEQTNACRHVDAQLARVVAILKKRGMEKDTAIVLTADHGGSGKKHGMAVLDCFEIPFIVWSPAHPKNDGWRLREPVVNADAAPTVLSLLGLDIPDAMRGRCAVGAP